MENTPPVSSGNPKVPDGFKWCVGCARRLPKLFFKGKKLCRTCAKKSERAARLLKKFGLTIAEYDHLLVHQGGVCAICKLAPKGAKYHVDHDHKTGVIRGILCMWCNHKLLAGARESILILERAIEYLKNPPAWAIWGKRQAPG